MGYNLQMFEKLMKCFLRLLIRWYVFPLPSDFLDCHVFFLPRDFLETANCSSTCIGSVGDNANVKGRKLTNF